MQILLLSLVQPIWKCRVNKKISLLVTLEIVFLFISLSCASFIVPSFVVLFVSTFSIVLDFKLSLFGQWAHHNC